MPRLLGPIALCLALIAAPLAAQDTATTPEGPIAVTETAADDARIETRIRDILGELTGYENVTVSVKSGIVTLSGRVLDGDTTQRLQTLVARVEGVVAIENEVAQTTDLTERLDPALDRFTQRMEQAIAYAPLLLVALIAGLLVAGMGFLLAGLRQPWERIAPNPFIADILRQFLRLAFSVAAVVVALDILGATALLGTFLGAAGIIGLALGFAVKDTVENFIASVMLSLRQPFRPNDLVEIEGDTGRVIRLTSRATILLSLDGNHVRIPNATVFKARIVNFTRNDERRFSFSLGVDSGADLARVREVGIEALKGLNFVLDTPPPGGWVERVGDSNVEFTFIGWISQGRTDFALARSEAIRIVKAAIERAGFALPEPIYRVRMEQAGDEAHAPKPRPQVPQAVEPGHDATLEGIVAAEREDTKASDLLDHAAPEE